LSRQYAVTKRKPVTVEFFASEMTNFIRITTTGATGDVQEVHRTEYLPLGVRFKNNSAPDPVTFSAVGGAGGMVQMTIQEKVQQRAATPEERTIKVWPMTGVTKVE